jgi:hypothetical protein
MLTVRVETKGAETKEHQTTRASNLCTLAPNICGSSVCNLLHVIILAPETFWLLLDYLFSKSVYVWYRESLFYLTYRMSFPAI